MPKLIVKRKAKIIQEFAINEAEKYTTIGSGEENDLVLLDEKIVEDHLFIEKQQDGYYVEDLGSPLGTAVNETKINSKTKLDDGDRIKIGNHTLIFRSVEFQRISEPAPSTQGKGSEKEPELEKATPSKVETEPPELEKTLTIQQTVPAKEKQKVENEVVEKTPDLGKTVFVAPAKPHYLLAIYGPYFGKKFKLKFDRTRIGRDKELNDIIISLDNKKELDTSISRRHATVFVKQGQFFVSDKRSQTRTCVNRKKLSESDEVPINPRDEIEIVSDKTSTIFRFVEEGDWDFSPPKRTGLWWIRWKYPFTKALSAFVIIGALIFLIAAWSNRSVVTHTPAPFDVNPEPWLAEQRELVAGEEAMEYPGQRVPTPILHDFSQDGNPDVILVDQRGQISAYDGKTREKMWPTFQDASVQLPLSPVLADVNGDGMKDITIATNDSRVYVISGDMGKEIWSSELLGGKLSTTPVVADFNGNGQMDVLVCSEDGKIYLGKTQGKEVEWKRFEQGHPINSTPSAADIDGDGVLEILIGNDMGEVLVFDGSLETIEKTIALNDYLDAPEVPEKQEIRSHLGLGDITGDDLPDLVIATRQGSAVAIDGQSLQRIWYHQFEDTDENKSFYHPAPVLGDFNSDGIFDVILCSTGGTVKALTGVDSNDNFVLWEYVEPGESFISTPSLADLNKDGTLDIVVSGVNGTLYIIDGRTGRALWRSAQSDIPDRRSTPVIGDIDGNGMVDILCAGIPLDRTSMFETNAKVFKGAVLWEQFSNGAAHTGTMLYEITVWGYNLQISLALLAIAGVVILNLFYRRKRKTLIGHIDCEFQ
jgi:pSer/pThr/pTyr-binding forkhead associated (FHA) protein/outer membrane protein assembly factor BamB